jgi:tellurite resistance protein TerC
MLTLDLLVFHRSPHEVSMKEAAAWSAVWIAMGLGFAGLILAWAGPTASGEYLAGYLIEKSLSVDNIFVFALLFSYFAVPAAYQHRVLFLGIVGALVFRGMFIAGGAALLDRFGWMVYVFGAFLVLTGIKMARHQGVEVHPEHNPVLRLVRRAVPMTSDYRGQRFFARELGRRLATPMLAVLVVVETTDIVFAVDSIPAIFAVTREPFLVFTSNAFAILGLRALYFLLAGLMGRIVYLKRGLAVVLAFVGVKMMVSDLYHMPVWISLGVIALILAATTILSLRSQPVPVDPDGSAQAQQESAVSDAR